MSINHNVVLIGTTGITQALTQKLASFNKLSDKSLNTVLGISIKACVDIAMYRYFDWAKTEIVENDHHSLCGFICKEYISLANRLGEEIQSVMAICGSLTGSQYDELSQIVNKLANSIYESFEDQELPTHKVYFVQIDRQTILLTPPGEHVRETKLERIKDINELMKTFHDLEYRIREDAKKCLAKGLSDLALRHQALLKNLMDISLNLVPAYNYKQSMVCADFELAEIDEAVCMAKSRLRGLCLMHSHPELTKLMSI